MTVRIEMMEAKHGINCTCCKERIRTCEKFIAVVNNDTDKIVRGERYCTHCEEYAIANHEDELADPPCSGDDHPDSEYGLRLREAYAGYAGNSSAFWDDVNAGYIK